MLPSAVDAELSALLGEYWRTDDLSRRAYGEDNSRRYALPAGVALPDNHEQVASLVRACRRHRVPIVARGAGTSSTGAAIPYSGGVVLSFERMNRIVQIQPGDRYAVVEPGVLNGDLQRALAPYGLLWAPDPASADVSTIGGNLACNAGGPHAVKYGTARDNVLALTAISGTCASRAVAASFATRALSWPR